MCIGVSTSGIKRKIDVQIKVNGSDISNGNQTHLLRGQVLIFQNQCSIKFLAACGRRFFGRQLRAEITLTNRVNAGKALKQ